MVGGNMGTFRKVMSVLFVLMTIVLSYLLGSPILFQFSRIYHLNSNDSIGIIGGIDFKISILPILIPTVIMIVTLISLLTFNVFNIIFAFIKTESIKIRIGFIIWCVSNVVLFMIIPRQVFADPFYLMLRPVICIVTLLTLISHIPSKEMNS